MATVQEQYKNKLVTAAEAAQAINSGDHIWFPVGGGEPIDIPQALAARAREVENVSIHQILTQKPTFSKPEFANHVKHVSWFASAANRQAVNEGWADMTASYFHEVPKLLREYWPVDVVMAMVSPMDKNGYFSLSLGVDYTFEALKKAKKVILEVNSECPRTLGYGFVHISQVTHLVESKSSVHQLKIPPITAVEEAIGNYVAEKIKDGATLQIGYGGIPNAVAAALKNKRYLGVHTEMITDGIADLVECGAVDNSRKTLHAGKIVGTFALGTKKLYNFLDDNPLIEMHPVDYTNDPYVIGRNDNMVSINAAIEVDLRGQCASETMGHYQWSGTGGQADFFRGANRSKGGQGFVTLSSTAKGGTISRIVAELKPGAVVTTTKNTVDYVVTEHGVAKLRGKTYRQRALELINIAHPSFRAELKESAQKLNLV